MIDLHRLFLLLDKPTVLCALIAPIACVLLTLVGLSQVAGRPLAVSPWIHRGALLATIIYAVFACHYPFRVGVYDHVEPTVLEIVGQVMHGRPAYHAMNAPSIYSVPYGPNAYAAHALAARVFGNPLLTAKVISAAFALASLGLVIAAIRAMTPSLSALSAGLVYFCGAAMMFREKLVWIRSDPQLLFWASVGLWGATRRRAMVAVAIVGAAAGACMNTKVHGFLYLVPAIALVCHRCRAREWTAFCVALLVMAVPPFLISPSFSFTNYLAVLSIAAKPGVGSLEGLNTVIVGGFLLLPVLLVGVRWLAGCSDAARRSFFHTWRPHLLVFCGGVVALASISAKHGAGEWYWLPFVPAGALMIALAWRGPDVESVSCAEDRFMIDATVAVFAAVALLGGVLAILHLPGQLRHAAKLVPVRDDVKLLGTRYIGDSVAMGCGDNDGYRQTFFRTELPLGAPLIVDPVALMDLQQAGLPLPAATLDALRTGAIKRWLIPRDQEPFTMKNFYAEQDLFGPQWRDIFREHYRKTESTAYFDVWSFK
jgi:hypothetical protein